MGLSSLEMWVTAGLQLKTVWACPWTSYLSHSDWLPRDPHASALKKEIRKEKLNGIFSWKSLGTVVKWHDCQESFIK